MILLHIALVIFHSYILIMVHIVVAPHAISYKETMNYYNVYIKAFDEKINYQGINYIVFQSHSSNIYIIWIVSLVYLVYRIA